MSDPENARDIDLKKLVRKSKPTAVAEQVPTGDRLAAAELASKLAGLDKPPARRRRWRIFRR